MQADRIFVCDGSFIGLTLAIAPLKGWAGNEIAVRVGFNDDGEGKTFHD